MNRYGAGDGFLSAEWLSALISMATSPILYQIASGTAAQKAERLRAETARAVADKQFRFQMELYEAAKEGK